MGLKISKWRGPGVGAPHVQRRLWKADPWPRGMVAIHPHMLEDPWLRDREVEVFPSIGAWAIRDPDHPSGGGGILTRQGQCCIESMMVRILIGGR